MDLGCGCGGEGIAALKWSGAQPPVTFNDIDPQALEAVRFNAHVNDLDLADLVLDSRNYLDKDPSEF